MLPGASRDVGEKILQAWLLGVPRDQIAQSMSVAEGTVTNVMEFYRQNDNSLDLQRQIAVIVRKTGTDINQLASNLHWENALKREGSENERVIQFISDLHKEFDLNGINERHAVSTIVQIADIVTTEKIPLMALSGHLEKEYAELERVELDMAKNNEVLERSNADVGAALVRNKVTQDEIKRFSWNEKTLQHHGLSIGDLTRTVTFIRNLKQRNYETSLIIFKLSHIVSLEDRLVELDKECENYEINLKRYKMKLKAAENYWGVHEASADLFANAISMGVSPRNIFDAVTIFGNNLYYTPQELIRDLEIYGDIKAALFKRWRELKGPRLNANTLLT
jgi:hypothetical protein